MTKKIVTVTPVVVLEPAIEPTIEPVPVTMVYLNPMAASIAAAIALDVSNCLLAKTSAREVSNTFDAALTFNWTAFKGNSSALKCGITGEQFAQVANTRDTYKAAWQKAGLPNFDKRWQYVGELSRHFVAPAATTPTPTTKSKTAPTAPASSAESVICPVKKAIEQVSSIPTLVLGLKPSQCSEALRKQIAAMCGDLCELLNQIK